LHLFLELHPSLDADAIAADARERRVGVATLTGYFLGQPTRSGLVIGYGGVSLEQAREGAAILASAIATAAGRGDPRGSRT
jgi:GntR family transcriptional regulator/MocR family aminotransferase